MNLICTVWREVSQQGSNCCWHWLCGYPAPVHERLAGLQGRSPIEATPSTPSLLIAGCSHLGRKKRTSQKRLQVYPKRWPSANTCISYACIPVTLMDSVGLLGLPSHGTIVTAQSFPLFCIPTSSASSWKNKRPLTRRTLEIHVGIVKTMEEKCDQLPKGPELTTWCSGVIRNDFHQRFQLVPLRTQQCFGRLQEALRWSLQ